MEKDRNLGSSVLSRLEAVHIIQSGQFPEGDQETVNEIKGFGNFCCHHSKHLVLEPKYTWKKIWDYPEDLESIFFLFCTIKDGFPGQEGQVLSPCLLLGCQWRALD